MLLWSFEGVREPRAFTISAVLPAGKHLFPFRTEKLSLPGPMVLGAQAPGRVGRRRLFLREGAARAALFHGPTGPARTASGGRTDRRRDPGAARRAGPLPGTSPWLRQPR